jgi:hypothetical protein
MEPEVPVTVTVDVTGVVDELDSGLTQPESRLRPATAAADSSMSRKPRRFFQPTMQNASPKAVAGRGWPELR